MSGQHTSPAPQSAAASSLDSYSEAPSPPAGTLRNLPQTFRSDLISGFLVFLIAMPLCLAIAIASGFPPIAGIFTGIIGGLIATFFSNSELTIKGPAAGLIVIVVGCVTDFGYTAGQDPVADMQAYKLALGVGVAAAFVQMGLALLRAGVLGEFFPSATVHGMLAAIGVIIIAKQIPIAVGLTARGEPLELLSEIPHTLAHMNPEIALIGAVSLLILFGMPLLVRGRLKRIPAQLVVILVAVPIGIYFDLAHEHTYTLHGHVYSVGEQHLVNVPFSMLNAVTFPDFSGLLQPMAWKWVLLFALIGSLESLLSAKAIDAIDPWKRKTNLNRDTFAVGLGNLVSSCVGGLPMISEIVRSRANIDNGAQTRFANMFHGLFLLVCVALFPALIHRIPMAALAAMLIYTGFRLAHPREFVHAYKIGRDQLIVYVTTIVAVLATDLLIGIGIGIALNLILHRLSGVPVRALFRPGIVVTTEADGSCRVQASDPAVFSNWLRFRRELITAGIIQQRSVTVDLSEATLVDHTVMEKLHELEMDFQQAGVELRIVGLDNHRPLSDHPHAARRLLKTT